MKFCRPRRLEALSTLVWGLTVVSLVCFHSLAMADEPALPPVVVTATRPAQDSPFAKQLTRQGANPRSTGHADTASLLDQVPGVSLYGAGGLSSLPSIHGLADDRLRIQVNGMDLQSACPNHMNSALSYIAPSEVSDIKVHAGVTPVSVGGDSIGGTIEVKSAPPGFATLEQQSVSKGQVGAFYRTNGNARGANLRASTATTSFFIQYTGDTAQADNFKAARAFKAEAPGTEGGRPIPSDEVGSTAYHYVNHHLGLAYRFDDHLLQLDVGQQHVLFEGFPNQRMDMTGNRNTTVNLRYRGEFDWGGVEARAFTQRTRHAMDMGPDRYSYGTGMPMLTNASTDGGQIKFISHINDRDTLRAGAEFLYYNLFDWWPPVGGSMGPRAFWNVDNGRRDRLGAFVEWERQWSSRWSSQLGIRHDHVASDAGSVQGYDNGLDALWGNDAAAFNVRASHRHVDSNWDMTALSTLRVNDGESWSFGFARKNRSPSLYQRYPWSTQPMAALMNNYVGDGNGYIGNENLKPEVAHTASVTSQWSDWQDNDWNLQFTGYVTHIENYIDARRCDFGQCSASNQTAQTGFVLLQYTNQRARMHGLDLSGDHLLHRFSDDGQLSLSGQLSYVRGTNSETGEPLYNIMPANIKLGLSYRKGGWMHSADWQTVQGKHRVSDVRNEVQTGGYSVLNLTSGYEWQNGRLDFRLENALDRMYQQPLGGAYVGQGPSMTTNGIPWGVVIPGMGRALTVAFSLKY